MVKRDQKAKPSTKLTWQAGKKRGSMSVTIKGSRYWIEVERRPKGQGFRVHAARDRTDEKTKRVDAPDLKAALRAGVRLAIRHDRKVEGAVAHAKKRGQRTGEKPIRAWITTPSGKRVPLRKAGDSISKRSEVTGVEIDDTFGKIKVALVVGKGAKKGHLHSPPESPQEFGAQEMVRAEDAAQKLAEKHGVKAYRVIMEGKGGEGRRRLISLSAWQAKFKGRGKKRERKTVGFISRGGKRIPIKKGVGREPQYQGTRAT